MTYATIEQRREAREAVSHPGKFEGESPMVPILAEIVMSGCADEECDDSDSASYALVGRWIVLFDEQGSVRGQRFESRDEAAVRFKRIADSIDAQY